MLGSFLFWFIILYLLYKFIAGFVLPVAGAAKNMRHTIKKMQDDANENETTQTQQSRSTSKKPVGEYIDFEEVD